MSCTRSEQPTTFRSTGKIRVRIGLAEADSKVRMEIFFTPDAEHSTARSEGKERKQYALFLPTDGSVDCVKSSLVDPDKGVPIRVGRGFPDLIEVAVQHTLVEVEVGSSGDDKGGADDGGDDKGTCVSSWKLRAITIPAPGKKK